MRNPRTGHPLVMTVARMTECLETLRWSIRDMTGELGVNERTGRRWKMGVQPIPAPVAAWLEALVVAKLKVQVPVSAQRPGGSGRPPGGNLYPVGHNPLPRRTAA